MRSFLYLTVVAALALGLIWAGSFAAFLVSMLFMVFSVGTPLAWTIYAVVLLALAAPVAWHTLGVVAAVRRRGAAPEFRGWRYWAAGACVVALAPNLLWMIAVFISTRANHTSSSWFPTSAHSCNFPVVLLAVAACRPGSRSTPA